MPIDPSVNALLSQGAKALSFDGRPPIAYSGTVIDATVSQQTDTDQKLKFFDDGKPMMQIVVVLQTNLRDQGPEDDGVRRLFIKGQAIKALQTALKGHELDTGGLLGIEYIGDDEAKRKPGKNAPKLYRCQYQPPSPTAAANDLLATVAPASSGSAASWAQDGGTPAPAAPPRVNPFAATGDFIEH